MQLRLGFYSSPKLYMIFTRFLFHFCGFLRFSWQWSKQVIIGLRKRPRDASPESVEEKLVFLDRYGDHYGYASGEVSIDRLRESDFSRLHGIVYLDHAGATLHADSQLRAAVADYSTQLYGNPHSQSDSSARTEEVVKSARRMVLEHFNASPKDYACIFTSGATAALKLIGEIFPWSSDSTFKYTVENHNSVLGIREYALAEGAVATAVDVDQDLVIRERSPQTRAVDKLRGSDGLCYSLFAMPTECNFSGAKFDLELVRQIKQQKHGNERWLVLLDAAKGAATSPPDLSRYSADFVVTSFYKIFGYPTGLGALIVHRDAAKILRKKYFGGGTVEVSIADIDYYKKRESPERWLEDGTLSFLSVAALIHGFSVVRRIGMSQIARHTWSLTDYVASKLSEMKHANGAPVCHVYGKHGDQAFREAFRVQGPVVTFNLKRADGSWVGHREVDKLASLNHIHLRTGCFCNPGACAKHLDLSNEDMISNFEAGHVCWDDNDIMFGKPTGAIRISFGYMSTFEDCRVFLIFLRRFFVENSCHSLARTEVKDRKTEVRLKSIVVYPIKSCAGFRVDSWPADNSGLRYDREWLLADIQNIALTQKKVPSMCLIRPIIDMASRRLIVSAPHMEKSIEIPLDEDALQTSTEVRLCGQRAKSKAYGPEISQWFTEALGVECTLIRKDVGFQHACRWRRSERAMDTAFPGEKTESFANEGQFLLISDASLKDLSKRVREATLNSKLQLDPMQFRPNLVVSGGIPYDEDRWNMLRIGKLQLPVIGGCNRCKMISIDQRTGKHDAKSEPLLTLASYRRTRGKVLFGTLLGAPVSDCDGDTILTVGAPMLVNYL